MGESSVAAPAEAPHHVEDEDACGEQREETEDDDDGDGPLGEGPAAVGTLDGGTGRVGVPGGVCPGRTGARRRG